MTVPAGTPVVALTVGTVTPSSLAGGMASLSGTTLTYSFTATPVINSGTAVSIQINGFTNTSTAGTYPSTITTKNGGATVDSGTTPSVTFTLGALVTPTWSSSKTATGATAASYTYGFTTATASSLTSVTMTVPAGTPVVALTVGTVTPSSLAGGTASLSGTTLTYSFTATPVINSGTAVSIQINGFTNTSTAGTYPSTITTKNGGATVDSGTTPTVTFTLGALVTPTWSSSKTATGATAASYTYRFTTATATSLSSITMTVPAGTPVVALTVGTVTPSSLAGGTAALSGTTLTYSFTATPVINSGTAVSIQINGFTNTSTAGTYPSEITTNDSGANEDSGTTPGVVFTGTLTLTSPSSFTWTVTLSGSNQSVVDAVPADQQLTVNDSTGTGAGWNITVSATTFTNGTHTLPNIGTFVFTGSLASPTTVTAPSTTCVATCTLPTDATTYPVAVTTAPSSPPAVKVYDTSPGTGLGAITIGGHSAARPIGWWVNVPANAYAGSYTSTVTMAIVSGP